MIGLQQQNFWAAVLLEWRNTFCPQESQHVSRRGRHRPAGGLLAGIPGWEEAGGWAARHGLQEHSEERLPLAAGQQATRWGQQRPTGSGQHHGHDCGHQGEEQERWVNITNGERLEKCSCYCSLRVLIMYFNIWRDTSESPIQWTFPLNCSSPAICQAFLIVPCTVSLMNKKV